MTKLVYYIWLILLALYILSPFDAHPHIFDDIIAAGVLFYLLYRNAKKKRQRNYTYSHGQSQEDKTNESRRPLDLHEAHKLFGINPSASWEEVKKAYKEKIILSHPDKVNHLSIELQEKAKELTLRLNKALDIIKREKK